MKKLWNRLRFVLKIHRFIPFLKDFFLSREVRLATKLWSIIVFGLYLVMPFDAIPDFIPMLGFVDDATVLMLVLQHIVKLAPPTLREKYRM